MLDRPADRALADFLRLDEDLLDHVPGADGRPLGRRLLGAVRSGGVALAAFAGVLALHKTVTGIVAEILESDRDSIRALETRWRKLEAG